MTEARFVFQRCLTVSATNALAACRIAARLSILRITSDCVFAAAGLSVFAIAAAFPILSTHLAMFAFAAIHGRRIALPMFFAAGHLFAIFALAASGSIALSMAAGLTVIRAVMVLVLATSTT